MLVLLNLKSNLNALAAQLTSGIVIFCVSRLALSAVTTEELPLLEWSDTQFKHENRMSHTEHLNMHVHFLPLNPSITSCRHQEGHVDQC